MERARFSGVKNIVRFNWHFYLLAALVVLVLIGCSYLTSDILIFPVLAALTFVTTILSLVVSAYIYDFSTLYSLTWLDTSFSGQRIVNIHAGFDETTHLLKARYPDSQLSVFDFYDPDKHTEISIERARKAFPPPPETIRISTNAVPLTEQSTDIIFLILAAHEIRDAKERALFFDALSNSLSREGKIIVIEHLRDLNNFIAFNFGFFHFFTRTNWLTTFLQAGLTVHAEFKITPFITVFILQKNGSTS
jgi:hypothetical protein